MNFLRQLLLLTCVAGLLPSLPAAGQTTGTVRGKVTDQKTGTPLPSVNVVVKGTTAGAATDERGEYEIKNLPPGTYTLVVSLVGHEPLVASIVMTGGAVVTKDFVLADVSVQFGDVTVYGASKRPERITEAPAAISTIAPAEIRLNAAHGQLPRLLESEPGVDIVQSGVQDFNINTRGFNSSLNRRLLVLLDGRDLAIAFLGAQEWIGLPIPLEDIGRLELVRGPGSALYGPNAFNGVINIATPAPRDILGTKVTMSGGELTMFRGDVRHAGMVDEHWSYRTNIGRVTSRTWSTSRTSNPLEYQGLPLEARPLDAGDVKSTYGSARLDYDFDGQGVLTGEGGLTEVENEVFITGIGRVQVRKAHKPWGRINYSSDRLNVMVWGQGRKSLIPQYSLASGAALDEKSEIWNAEVQYNFSILDEQLRFIFGGSHRLYKVDTFGSLMPDKRSDNTSGLFGQTEYEPLEWLKIVGALRWDRSTLHKNQYSPKGGVVVTPLRNHSIRATYNQAFQVPNYSEFFLRANAAAPTASPRQLELGLEGYFAAVKAALPAPLVDPLVLPTNIPWNFSSQTQVLALGNNNLTVEKIKGFEVGYKGIFLENKLFVTLDGYFNKLENFITDLLPAVNPAYPRYSLSDGGTNITKNLNDLEALYNQLNLPPTHPLRVNLAALRAGYTQLSQSQLIALLATLPDGQRAGVLSYTNAGKVDETGTELGFNFYVLDELLLTGNWTWYDFKVKEQQTGDVLLPNAPKHKFAAGATYTSPSGYEISVSARNVQPFKWAAGIFQGDIPAYTLVNLSAGYQFTPNYRIGVYVSNLFDNKVYQLFGGSLIGRQAITTLTATF
jgi:outer membrane receptor for ferrienterochelin and colicins